MQAIGIDLGSSSIKGALLDLETLTITNVISEAFPEPLVAGSPHFEIDIAAVVSATRHLIQRLLEIQSTLTGLFACGQMGGLVFVRPDGSVASNYYSWRDLRTLATRRGSTQPFLSELQTRLGADTFNRLGKELKPGSALSLLGWLSTEGDLPTGDAYVMTMGDCVLTQLTGEVACTDLTQTIGLLDMTTGDWCRDVVREMCGRDFLWTEFREAWQTMGTLRSVSFDLPCYPVLGDQQAALVGCGLRSDELSINVSTGSQVSRLTESWQPGDYQSRMYPGGRFLNTLTHLPAGRSLNVLFDLVTTLGGSSQHPGALWSQIEQAVADTPATDLKAALTFFPGPLGEVGRIENIRVDNLTVGSLFRAAFENMGDNYQVCTDRIWPERDFRTLVLSGGLPQKLPTLREAVTGRFGKPFRMQLATEETLQGLLAVALVANGRCATVDTAGTLLNSAS